MIDVLTTVVGIAAFGLNIGIVALAIWGVAACTNQTCKWLFFIQLAMFGLGVALYALWWHSNATPAVLPAQILTKYPAWSV